MTTTVTSIETQSMDHTHKPTTKIRKRAPKACLSCRARKVRCDVSQRGRPCMNCYLDSEACVVTGRASRFRRPQRETTGDNVEASHPPYTPKDPHACSPNSAEAVVKSRMNTLAEPPSHASQQDDIFGDGLESPNGPEGHHDSRRDSLMTESLNPQPRISQQSSHQRRVNNGQTNYTGSVNQFSTMNNHTQNGLTSDIVYSYYPFLTMGNLPNIPPQDVNYLELQGCLRVPTRALLDEFLQQYFLHVHPLLPILNEGDFWDLYCHSANAGMPTERMSLLVFQAVLFASCNFVSRSSIKALGYPNIRAARAALYRRAKLLYDFESESSSLSIAQAALLLSFWSPSSTRNPNTSWLSLAIQHAKSAEAHHYAAMPVFSAATHPMQHRKQNILKKVWWCCVIRDRTLGLLMRRPIQITKAHFDFQSNPILGFADLDNEFERSRVYNPGTKKTLAEILAQILELYVVLTDILMLVFPLDDAPGWGRQSSPENAIRIQECKTALRRWYKSASSRFPLFGGSPLSHGGTDNRKEFQHDSAILYTNLMYMYYHSSRVVLAHHEILHLAILQAIPNGDSPNAVTSTRGLSTIYENRHELQDAASGVTECLKELVHLKLARWLPISAVACTALPLVLNILDVKLSAPAKDPSLDSNAASALKQHRLNILIEAMRTYQPQYDGVDWVSEIVRHVVNLAQVDNANPQGNQNPNITDWTDILALQPSSYLRLALALDVSLSKGRLPEDGDFPVSLRGLFVGGFSPLKALIEANRASNPSHRFGTGSDVNLSNGLSAVQCSHSDSDSHNSPLSQTDSHMSNTDEAAIEALREQIRSQMATDGPSNTNTLPSEGINGLGADPNSVFQVQEESPSGTSEFEGMYLDGPMPDISAEWIETVWDEMGNTDDKADRDIARMLLGALKDGDMGESMV
ncbi:fungal-specific transcription factor domain-containing protein [Thelonectria olida]|uniref:Fungal-specific transcription factor domain-containing protein n=1 Tax=Thelonectria olida TaxID=1576542 RepID=A0A9P9AN64_9HYPO|nr:fungal-specific transcription factor domain-containing protein [Thelonectria olida]